MVDGKEGPGGRACGIGVSYDCDSPEHLLDSGWQRLGGVVCFCCGQPDELGAGEGESCCHEDVAEALETIVECAWILPVSAADVA